MLEELIEEFVSVNYSTDASRRTVKYALRWLIRYMQQKGYTDFSQFTPRDVVEFRYFLSRVRGRHGRPLSNRTIGQIISFTRAFFDFLEALGYENPFRKLPQSILSKLRPRVKTEKVPEEFTSEQLEQIFKALKEYGDEDVYLACLIAYATGARLNEILHLRAEDVIVKDGMVYIAIRAGKGLRERISIVGVPTRGDPVLQRLNREAREKLVERARKVGSGYLFGDEDERRRLRLRLQQALYRLSKKLGFRVHIHAFRSNWGSKALEAGVPLEVVSKQLGHKFTQTTESFYATLKQEQVLATLSKFVS